MKKALDLLVDEGLLFRKRGQGSFVMSNVEQKNILSINERSPEGLTKSSHGKATTKVLSFQMVFATKQITKALEIRMDDPVYEIVRVRSINSRPYVMIVNLQPILFESEKASIIDTGNKKEKEK